jgi:type III secretion system FlhB-like substrate exporter
MSAPKVVAKGAGFVADRIKQEARRYGVPVLAEVLAYLYRLRGVSG